MIKVKDLIEVLLALDGEAIVALETPYGDYCSFSTGELEGEVRVVGDKVVLPMYGYIEEWNTELAQVPPEEEILDEEEPVDQVRQDEFELDIIRGSKPRESSPGSGVPPQDGSDSGV